jgi:hypothetical protein
MELNKWMIALHEQEELRNFQELADDMRLTYFEIDRIDIYTNFEDKKKSS